MTTKHCFECITNMILSYNHITIFCLANNEVNHHSRKQDPTYPPTISITNTSSHLRNPSGKTVKRSFVQDGPSIVDTIGLQEKAAAAEAGKTLEKTQSSSGGKLLSVGGGGGGEGGSGGGGEGGSGGGDAMTPAEKLLTTPGKGTIKRFMDESIHETYRTLCTYKNKTLKGQKQVWL